MLGENALLARALAEAVGGIARALGPAMARRLLRTVLLPLLERLAEPCGLVAGAAGDALDSVCAHCGCVGVCTTLAHTHTRTHRAMHAACGPQPVPSHAPPPPPPLLHAPTRTPHPPLRRCMQPPPRTRRYHGSLRALLSANADFVVDALCAQLRDLNAHPRAPLLLAALLRRSGGVAPHMLPLMAEPMQAALRVRPSCGVPLLCTHAAHARMHVHARNARTERTRTHAQGLSIIARRQQPRYTRAFLAAASEVAWGAAQEAEDAAALTHAACGALRARVAAAALARRGAAGGAEADDGEGGRRAVA